MLTRLDTHRDQAGAWDVISGASGNLALDIGSNIGQAARVLAQNFTRVVSLEPCEESYSVLAAEMPANVTCLPHAVSDHDGEITLDVADRSIGTGQLVTGPGLPMWGERTGTRTVKATTLDSLLATYGPPDFVKVDVEGHECQVLAGGTRLFTEVRPYVIVEVHRAENELGVRGYLPGYDLTVLRHGDYVRKDGVVYQNHYWIHGSWRG